MNVVIRKAGEEDEKAIYPLWKEQTVFHYELDPAYYVSLASDEEQQYHDYFLQTLETNDPHFLVAEVDEKIVGFTTVKKSKAQYFDSIIEEYGWVLELFVDEEYRNHGIGKQLLDEAAKVMRSEGIEYLKLEVSSRNTNAQKFYEDSGFDEHIRVMVKKIL